MLAVGGAEGREERAKEPRAEEMFTTRGFADGGEILSSGRKAVVTRRMDVTFVSRTWVQTERQEEGVSLSSKRATPALLMRTTACQ